MTNIPFHDQFVNRHIGTNNADRDAMLQACGVKTLDQLMEQTVPKNIRSKKALDLPETMTEHDFLRELAQTAAKNKVFRSYIGQGYHQTITPSAIARNIFHNPGWYTQYTPYQAEIAQGRLEALLNFQTMVSDLTGLPIANASLLDEGTAAAEAMAMFFAQKNKRSKTNEFNAFFVSDKVLVTTIDILETRAKPLGIDLIIGDAKTFKMEARVFGILLQYPGEDGAVEDYGKLVKATKDQDSYVTVAADILSLALLTPPGEWGADAVSAIPSVSAYRWATADRMPLILPPKNHLSASSPAVSSACPLTNWAIKPCGWPSKHANNTSVAKKPRPTFVRRRHYWPLWRECMRSITDKTASAPSPNGYTNTPSC